MSDYEPIDLTDLCTREGSLAPGRSAEYWAQTSGDCVSSLRRRGEIVFIRLARGDKSRSQYL